MPLKTKKPNQSAYVNDSAVVSIARLSRPHPPEFWWVIILWDSLLTKARF